MSYFWIAARGMSRGYDIDTQENAPLFRREFEIDARFQSARILICALGYYELYLNG